MTQKFTPQQACSSANSAGNQKVEEFIMESSVLELQEFCHCLHEGHPHDKYFPLARIAIDIKLAEEADRTAQKLIAGTDTLIIETRTLVKLTKWLIGLTIVLAIIASFEIFKFLLGLLCDKTG